MGCRQGLYRKHSPEAIPISLARDAQLNNNGDGHPHAIRGRSKFGSSRPKTDPPAPLLRHGLLPAELCAGFSGNVRAPGDLAGRGKP